MHPNKKCMKRDHASKVWTGSWCRLPWFHSYKGAFIPQPFAWSWTKLLMPLYMPSFRSSWRWLVITALCMYWRVGNTCLHGSAPRSSLDRAQVRKPRQSCCLMFCTFQTIPDPKAANRYGVQGWLLRSCRWSWAWCTQSSCSNNTRLSQYTKCVCYSHSSFFPGLFYRSAWWALHEQFKVPCSSQKRDSSILGSGSLRPCFPICFYIEHRIGHLSNSQRLSFEADYWFGTELCQALGQCLFQISGAVL